jgi:hypothetical protein
MESTRGEPIKSIRLTSLLGVEERLTEAEYFARRLFDLPDTTAVGYELNAFVSAARSVTFLLQKEFKRVEGFDAFWTIERAKLREDEAARFFVDLRNYSQKEGHVSIVGTQLESGKWRFMFAGTVEPVPALLLGRDVADCCLDHLAKLSRAVLHVAEVFPFHTCPDRALTPGGIAALGLDLDAVEVALGFPPEVSAARPDNSVEVRTRLLRRYVDPVDFAEIRRIAEYQPLPALQRGGEFGVSLGLSMVEHIERSRATGQSCNQAVRVAIVGEALGIKLDDSDR